MPPTSNNHDPESSVIIRSASGNSQSTSTYSDKNLLNWFWPAEGNIISKFSVFNNKNKGIDIAGNNGDSVFAAESGEVVYAGNGLLRYGELVIVKHNDQFLSAYAHNDSLDVSEGDIVRRGQKIADLGSTGIDRNMLHFEIRLAGQPVDPEKYLPLK